MATSKHPPLTPKDGWLSDGRQLLHFRPTHWNRWSQRLELITGELLPGQPVPLPKHRRELTREQAITLWRQMRQEGWRPCRPQW